MTWGVGIALLSIAVVLVAMLANIERRIVKLQRWVEMHAEPAPQLSEADIAKKRELRRRLGHGSEDVEHQLRRERQRRRRLSLAQYVMDLRAMKRHASHEGWYDTAVEYSVEADRLTKGER